MKKIYITLFARFLKENELFDFKKFNSFYDEIIYQKEYILPHTYMELYNNSIIREYNFVSIIHDILINDIMNAMHNELSMLDPKIFGYKSFYEYFSQGLNNYKLCSKIEQIADALNLNSIDYLGNICMQINNKKL